MRLASALSVLLFLFLIHRTIPKPSLSQTKFEDSEDDNELLDGNDEEASSFPAASSPSPFSSSDAENVDSPPSSPSSSSSDDDEEEEEEEEEFVENVAQWHPMLPFSKCPIGKFFEAKAGECRACSICGPDLYEREKCRPDRDTICEWCLTNLRIMNRNSNFRAKCEQLIALRDQFRAALAQRAVVGVGKTKPTIFSFSMLEGASKWWKIELFVEMAFYVTLIALVLAVIRFLAKSRATAYRTVTVTPPMLEEWEQKNIVRAAESIREKMGGKGYAKLDEEFI